MPDEPTSDMVPRTEMERAVAAERRKRRWVQLALAAAVALLLAGGGAFAWWTDRQAVDRARAEAEKSRIEAERARDEQDRKARNAAAVETLLGRAEEALRGDDAHRAALALHEAEKRLVEGGADHLKERLSRTRADLQTLRDLDRANDVRWAKGP